MGYNFTKYDKVLVKDKDNGAWEFAKYLGTSSDKFKVLINGDIEYYDLCIPYNEKTWGYLGTSDDYKEITPIDKTLVYSIVTDIKNSNIDYNKIEINFDEFDLILYK